MYRQRLRNWDEAPKSANPAPAATPDEDDGLLFLEGAELSRVFDGIRAHIPLIIVIAILGTLAGVGFALLQKTIYTASTTVQLDPRESDVTGEVDNVLAQLPANDMVLDTEELAIRSRPVLESVIAQLDLMDDAEFNWTLEEGALDEVEEMPSAEQIREDVLSAVAEALNVSRVGLTSVIRIRCDSERPAMAQALCNTVAETYIARQLERKVQATERADVWLSARIEELAEELQEKEAAIEAFRIQNQVIGVDGQTLSQQQIAQLNMQLAMVGVEVAEKRARLRQARAMRRGDAGTDSIAEVLGSEAVLQLREQQAEIIRRRAELSTRYRPTHPDMQQVEQELADVERQISREVDRILTNLSNEVVVAEERAASLQDSIDVQNQTMSENARTVVQLRELEQEAQATREIYLSFLSRAKGITDQASIQTPDSRVLSAAALPLEPSRPNRRLIVAFAGVLSVLAGMGMAVGLDVADKRIRTPDMARRATGLWHLGSVPLVTDRRYKGRPHRDLLDRGTSIFSEAFEELYTRLQSQSGPRPPRTILFTSAGAAEGKTTCALCFALSAARAGKRVVLLEGDLRCPTIYDVVAIQGVQVEDLKAVLDGDLDWEEVAWTEPQTGLRILPVKAPSDDPVAHLSSARLEELLEDLRAEFDVVVIDTAPVLPVNDALKLMPYADKVIFVQRWRTTTKQEAETAVRKIRDVGGDVAGSVLTFVDGRQRWRFGDGGLPNPSGRNRRYYGRG